MKPEDGEAESGRHISAGITRTVLTTVRRCCGEAGVDRVLAAAGEQRTADELEHLATWASYAEGRALMAAAAEVLGEPHALRRVGEYVAREDMTGEVVELLRSLGSPGEVLRNIGTAATKFCTVTRMEPLEIGECTAAVSARNVDGFPRFQEFCDITAGILSQATIPFGLPPAEVVEERCELRGDDRCVYRVAWSAGPAARSSASAEEIAALAARFAAFQSTAASLVSAADVDTVLDRIMADVGLAVRAPHHLLAVRGLDGDLRVHHSGLSAAEAQALATEMLDCDPSGDPSRLVVEVASAQRSYGRLAAIADGPYFFDGEHGLLASYARLAAAALDAATALEESRRQTETAELLLRLARIMSNVGELEEMAQRLVESLPGTLDCDVSQVWIWDATTSLLRLGACHGLDPQEIRRLKQVEIAMTDTAELPAMVTHPGPLFMDTTMDDAYLAGMMRSFGQVAAVAVPITAGPELLGVLTASVRERPERVADRPGLVARLEGCADLASTAFQNARLMGQIRHQALHDAVTGLPNKQLLQSRVDNALAAVARGGAPFALCFLDLDRFKHVNDTLGHAVGDLILHEVGARLTDAMRKVDTVARLGGDEFALLLPEAGTAGAAEVVAERISAALREPFLANGQPIYITSSIGVALAPAHGRTYDELVRNADVAMYRAKDHGRNRVTVFDARLRSGPAERLRLESDLHVAIARGELVVLYQPLVDPADGSVVGLEALVRWQHPVLGLLTPDRFLPLAEESYLIGEIDAYVLRRACLQLREWSDAGLPPVRISVNASERTVHDTTFPEQVAEVLRETAVPAAQLEIEVTEHVVDTRTGDVVHVLQALQALGVRLAIDDFGTGNSGLARLRTFPIDTLKIDRSFVAEVEDRSASAPLLSAMIRLGVDLGLEVVAEGVETEDQQAFLVDQGCQLAQGYLFARPLTAEDAGRAIAGEAAGAVPVTASPTDPSR